MAKRSAGSCIDNMEVKKTLLETEQMVLLKRVFQKDCARMDNNIIYKLDCKDLNSHEKNLVNVCSKKIYDELEVNGAYKFVLERRKNRFFLISYEKIEAKKLDVVDVLTAEDFNLNKELKTNFYVSGAYDYASIKDGVLDYIHVIVFGYINLNNRLCQCDLIIKPYQNCIFNRSESATKADRIKSCLKKVYNELLNKWWVFQVQCSMYGENDNFTLEVQNYIDISESTVTTSVIPEDIKSISYPTIRVFKTAQIKIVNKCILDDNKLKIDITSSDDKRIQGIKFQPPLDIIEDIVDDLDSINFSIRSNLAVYYCVYCVSITGNDRQYTNIITIIKCEDNDVETMFTGKLYEKTTTTPATTKPVTPKKPLKFASTSTNESTLDFFNAFEM